MISNAVQNEKPEYSPKQIRKCYKAKLARTKARLATSNTAVRKIQALAALITVLGLLLWTEVLSFPHRVVRLHNVFVNKKHRKGSVFWLLGWFAPLPRWLWWVAYVLPFLIHYTHADEEEDQEILDYLAKRKRLKRELRLFSVPSARAHYLKHFGQFYVYDLIPLSAKLCLIDTALTVTDTANLFLELGIEAAPFWDSAKCKIVGVCTPSSFVSALQRCTSSFVAYDTRKLDNITWQKIYAKPSSSGKSSSKYPRPGSVKPSDNWNQTIKAIKSNKLHRAVVFEENNNNHNQQNPLMLLGVHRLFQYIFYKLETYKVVNLFDMPVRKLDIGTFNDLWSVSLTTPFNEMIGIFKDSKVSTLPVVNQYGRLTYLLDKHSLLHIMTKCPTRVRLTVADVLKQIPTTNETETLLSRVCYEDDNLKDVITRLHACNEHSLVVLDENQIVKGMISVSDMLLFLGFSVGAFKKGRYTPIKTCVVDNS